MSLVSVIIPAHNRSELLPQAIESVLRQTAGKLELIVVDDGSTDGTADAVQRYQGDGRLRYVYQENAGRSAARNHGARLAQGEWLGFLDSDDCYLPTALADHLNVLEERPDAGLTAGGYQYVDAAGQSLGERKPWQEGELSLANWLFNCYALPGSVLLRRDWFERMGGFDPACEIAEDWDLFLRLARAGCPMAWTKTAVCQYRLHEGNSVTALDRHRQGSLRAIAKVFQGEGLPAEVAGLEAEATAWVYVLFARRAYRAGQFDLAQQNLLEAVRLDPRLGQERKFFLLEALLAAQPGETTGWQTAVANQLPPELKLGRDDLRRARARLEMAQFFRAADQGQRQQAADHLRAGLRLDPRWLANRGVVAFLWKRLLPSS